MRFFCLVPSYRWSGFKNTVAEKLIWVERITRQRVAAVQNLAELFGRFSNCG